MTGARAFGEASTVLRGVRGGRRQTPVTADAPSCPSPLGVLSTTSRTIASSPLQLCTVDGRSAGTACAEILTSWPTRRPFRRELGVRGVPSRGSSLLSGDRGAPYMLQALAAWRADGWDSNDAPRQLVELDELERALTKQGEAESDLGLK